MIVGLRDRLARLEDAVPSDCPACRGRVLVRVEQSAADPGGPAEVTRDDACSRCGRLDHDIVVIYEDRVSERSDTNA